MNNVENFCEVLEQGIEQFGLPYIIEALAEICRNRGNVLRENGPPYTAAARIWTYRGSILFDAASSIKEH